MKRLTSQDLQLQDAVRQFFIQLGENPDRDGIKETPKRFIAWAKEKKSFYCLGKRKKVLQN